jgi:hypothetical protein
LDPLNLLQFFNGYNWQALNLNDLQNLNNFVFDGLNLGDLNLDNLNLGNINLLNQNDLNNGIIQLIQEIQGLGNSNDVLLQSLEQQLVESMILLQQLQGNNVLHLGNNVVGIGKQ